MPTKLKANLPPLKLDDDTVGQRLARIRKARGYTQRELAEKIGINYRLVSEYETERLRLHDEMLTRFALALEVSTDEILGLKQIEHSTHVTPSLRMIRRLNKIETLPLSKQKALLQIIDGFLKGEEK